MIVKRALIVTHYRYPNGDAGSVRQHSFAKIYKELGYDVIVVGLGENTDFKVLTYDGVKYISFRNKKSDFITKVKNHLHFKKKLKNFLINIEDPDLIQAVNINRSIFAFLKKYSKKNGTKLVHDSVEWYSPEEFKLGRFSRAYKRNNNLNTKLLNKQFSVISISSFLEKHFSSKGINTVRIPVIMDIDSITCEKNTDSQKCVFLYAGSPGKKDYLAEIINAFALLSREKLEKFQLRLIGIKKEQLVTLCGADAKDVEYIGNSLVCLGRLPREDVLENLSKADFTVLLRSETQRYAKAGFPTKVVESLATGTPVVTNLTSDLGMYLADGINAVISKDDSVNSFSVALEKALNLSFEEKKAMFVNSRKTAEENFDYKIYKEKILELLDRDDK